ncbi:MAG: nitrile hydratase subunit beta [Alphaproteobacteria bacterium]|nr:nitrile hydratase subunit beta [Alphaproteobacteria bacterium]
MNGAHDLGGMHGLGPITREPNEPVFHAEWERRAFALTLAMGAHRRWTIDRSRFAREDRHPVDYLASSYYELWTKALERLATEEQFLAPGEIEAGRSLAPPPAHTKAPLAAADVAPMLARGTRHDRPVAAAPRFAPGDAVRVKVAASPLHTRAPRYCGGRKGTIHAGNGGYVFPDANAAGKGEGPQHLYTVRFAARELWGDAAAANDSVFIDLWESYLEPAR